ncbi:MAG: hypothetical protein Q8Q32_00815 [bacterium]|nr:hypothetical protein [bacterium]
MIEKGEEGLPSTELSPQTYKELLEIFHSFNGPVEISEDITLKPQGNTLAIVSNGETGTFSNSKIYTIKDGRLLIARLDAETIKKMNPNPMEDDLLLFDPSRTDQMEYLSEEKSLELLKFLRSLN